MCIKQKLNMNDIFGKYEVKKIVNKAYTKLIMKKMN